MQREDLQDSKENQWIAFDDDDHFVARTLIKTSGCSKPASRVSILK